MQGSRVFWISLILCVIVVIEMQAMEAHEKEEALHIIFPISMDMQMHAVLNTNQRLNQVKTKNNRPSKNLEQDVILAGTVITAVGLSVITMGPILTGVLLLSLSSYENPSGLAVLAAILPIPVFAIGGAGISIYGGTVWGIGASIAKKKRKNRLKQSQKITQSSTIGNLSYKFADSY